MKKVYIASQFMKRKAEYGLNFDEDIREALLFKHGNSLSRYKEGCKVDIFNETYNYIGPFWSEVTSKGEFSATDSYEVVKTELKLIDECDLFIAFLGNDISPGTIAELVYAASKNKEVKIYYVKDPEVKLTLKSNNWFPIMVSTQIGNNVDLIEVSGYNEFCTLLSERGKEYIMNLINRSTFSSAVDRQLMFLLENTDIEKVFRLLKEIGPNPEEDKVEQYIKCILHNIPYAKLLNPKLGVKEINELRRLLEDLPRVDLNPDSKGAENILDKIIKLGWEYNTIYAYRRFLKCERDIKEEDMICILEFMQNNDINNWVALEIMYKEYSENKIKSLLGLRDLKREDIIPFKGLESCRDIYVLARITESIKELLHEI